MDVRVVCQTLSSACGLGNAALAAALQRPVSPLQVNDYRDSHLDTWIGRVAGVEKHTLDPQHLTLNSRNNRLTDLALQQDEFTAQVAEVVAQAGMHRVGAIIGTSTSSVGRTESAYAQLDEQDQMPAAYQQPEIHNPHAPGHFVARKLGLGGPAMTISTACSSSSKVFAAGARWLESGLTDAVVVGGVDSLCLSILHGFASLELTSSRLCRPFDKERDGINIGEAAGFALLMRAAECDGSIRLAGFGESSDAYHMAQPHPEGRGAAQAMTMALKGGQLNARDIGYINLHGTASRANDLAETRAVASLFDDQTRVSSTKGWTGHTLGAAGITGAVIAMQALESGYMPATLNLHEPDADLAFAVMQSPEQASLQHVMCNSLGFGGNNCSLVFSKVVH